MAYLLATSFPTIVSVTASTQGAGTPASYAVKADRPFLPWRSSSLAVDAIPGWLRADFGTATVLDGVFLNSINVSRINVAASNDGTIWTTLGSSDVAIDRRVNRRKGYFRFAGFNHRYFRVEFPLEYYVGTSESGWTDTGDFGSGDEGLGGDLGKFQCGAFLPVGSVTALSIHAPVWPRDYLRSEAHEVIGYVGGGYEVNLEGPSVASFFLHLVGDRTVTGIAQAALFSALEDGRPFLLAEDFGHPEHAYYVVQDEDDELVETYALLERGRYLVREVF